MKRRPIDLYHIFVMSLWPASQSDESHFLKTYPSTNLQYFLKVYTASTQFFTKWKYISHKWEASEPK